MSSFIELEEKGAKVGDILLSRPELTRGPFNRYHTNRWQSVEGDPQSTDYDDLLVRAVLAEARIGPARLSRRRLGHTRVVKTTENLWTDFITSPASPKPPKHRRLSPAQTL